MTANIDGLIRAAEALASMKAADGGIRFPTRKECEDAAQALIALRPSPSSDERVDLRDSVIEDDADALKTWLWAEIGRLMHQAEHWANNGRPHAVLYRLHKADAYYQIIALCDRGNPFKAMRTEVARQAQDVPGAYPPSADLARYRDADFVASQAAAIRALQPHKGE
jgi:hypothetical protein